MKLESVSQKVVETLGQLMIAAIALLILFPLIGAWRQWRKSTSS
jgi:hypothetical protein